MKITAYNLRSIGGPKTIEVNGNLVLSGVNGAGKSTMLNVPYFVLTGKGLTLKNGTTEGYGSIEFNGISITRQKKEGSTTIRVNGKTCSETAMYEHLNKMKLAPEMLAVLFNSETTLNAETILKVADFKRDVDSVLTFTKLEGNALEFTKKLFKRDSIEILDIPTINKGYKKVYTMRTENNREIKRLRALVDADAVVEDVVGVDIAALVEQSTVVEREIEAIIDTIHQAKQEIATIENLKKVTDVKKIEKQKLLTTKCNFTEEDVKRISNEIAELQCREEELSQQNVELNKKVLELIERCSKLREQRQILTEQNNAKSKNVYTLMNTTTCPLNSAIPCTTDKSAVCKKIETEIENNKKEIVIIDANYDNENSELEEIKNKIANNNVIISEIKEKVRKLISERSNIEKERTDYALISGKVSAIEKIIEENENTIKTTVIQDITPLNEMLEEKRNSQKQIKEQIVNSSRVADAANRLAQNKRQLEEAEKVTDMLTVVLKELQVLPNKIFENVFKPVLQGMNGILAQIKSDWTVDFKFNGSDVEIYIVMPDGEVILDELSTGERVVVNYVLKLLVCRLIKFDVILLDNTDALDKKNYELVEKVVANAKCKTMLATCGDVKSLFPVVTI